MRKRHSLRYHNIRDLSLNRFGRLLPRPQLLYASFVVIEVRQLIDQIGMPSIHGMLQLPRVRFSLPVGRFLFMHPALVHDPVEKPTLCTRTFSNRCLFTLIMLSLCRPFPRDAFQPGRCSRCLHDCPTMAQPSHSSAQRACDSSHATATDDQPLQTRPSLCFGSAGQD
jgi:hypothetical protein